MEPILTEKLFIFILLIHFLADFALQTDEQAKGKSTYVKWLLYHVGVYSIIWLMASWFYFGDFGRAILFSSITFVAHYITDYITSRIGKPFWDKGDYHNGFVVVGFDQILHYLQLYYTFKLISVFFPMW
jgi:hypothetical protein